LWLVSIYFTSPSPPIFPPPLIREKPAVCPLFLLSSFGFIAICGLFTLKSPNKEGQPIFPSSKTPPPSAAISKSQCKLPPFPPEEMLHLRKVPSRRSPFTWEFFRESLTPFNRITALFPLCLPSSLKPPPLRVFFPSDMRDSLPSPLSLEDRRPLPLPPPKYQQKTPPSPKFSSQASIGAQLPLSGHFSPPPRLYRILRSCLTDRPISHSATIMSPSLRSLTVPAD